MTPLLSTTEKKTVITHGKLLGRPSVNKATENTTLDRNRSTHVQCIILYNMRYIHTRRAYSNKRLLLWLAVCIKPKLVYFTVRDFIGSQDVSCVSAFSPMLLLPTEDKLSAVEFLGNCTLKSYIRFGTRRWKL